MESPEAAPHGVSPEVRALHQRIRELEAAAAARDQVEAAARVRQARYEQLFEHSQAVKLIIDATTDQILDANPAATAFYGYSRAELQRQRLSDLTLPPPQLAGLAAEAQRAGATRFVVEHRLASGELRTVDVHTSPLALDGRTVHYAIIHDVTREQQAARELRASEQRFRATFEQAAVGMTHIDAHGEWLLVNQRFCAIVGYPYAALQTRTFRDITHPDDLAADLATFERFVAGELDTFTREKRYVRPDGSIVWVMLSGSVVRTPAEEPNYLVIAVEDITSRKHAEAHARRQLQRLATQRAIDLAIAASLDQRVMLTVILDHVVRELQLDAAAVLVLNPATQTLDYADGRGFRTPHIRETRQRLGEGLAGWAALDGRPALIADVQAHGDVEHAALVAAEGFRAYGVVPLVTRGQVKGVLEVFQREPLAQAPDWLEFLEALAGQTAIALDTTALFRALQHANAELTLAYDTTLEGWSRALDLRDHETEGHSQRVTELSLRLGRAMGVSDAGLVHLRRGALLHDIGKMGVPDQILLKPGPLTEAEWVIMRRHPVYSYELLAPIAYLGPALDIPYCHHEHWNGRGYPRGLHGDEIPLVARIFAVVDVWDALRSDRPYRPAWPEARALAHVREAAGSQFDPQVVVTFLRMLQDEAMPQSG